ncbi:MAG: restriction endonuclease subunit S [Candidatus Bathyarchaeia archaeon]|jgi:type I restriction enzyme S subunit
MSSRAGYKPTEIGEIPADWEIKQLGELVEYKKGKNPPEVVEERTPNTLPYLGIESLRTGITNRWAREADSLVKVGSDDIILVWDGFYSGEAFMGFNGLLSSTTVKVSPRVPYLDRNYLYYFLKTRFKELNSKHSGMYLKHVSKAVFESLKVPVPPLTGQQRIASILLTVDDAIQKTDEILEKTQQLKKGLMQQLLTKGIGHTKFKKTEVGEIPQEWATCRLQDACHEVTIGVVNPATPYYTTPDEGVPYFRTQNVRENILEPTKIYVTHAFNLKHSKSILREYDVLTVQTGFIGTSCLVPKKFEGANCHSLLITRTDAQKLKPDFFCQLMNSDVGHRIMAKFAQIAERGHILLEDFRVMRIPLPAVEEQEKIVTILSTTDKKIASEKLRKQYLEKLKKELLQVLLTGKVRVKVN